MAWKRTFSLEIIHFYVNRETFIIQKMSVYFKKSVGKQNKRNESEFNQSK